MSENQEATVNQEEVAIEQVVGFAQQFGKAHFHLACHAAFPLALTPDLLYQVWARFVDYAPWTAVAHLLLSQLCHETGHELYEMTTSVRDVLLTELKEDERFGKQRIEELANFLIGYVIRQLEGDNANKQDLTQAQHWTALAYLNPDKVTRELAEALQSSLQRQDMTEAFRLASLIETFPSVLFDLGFSPLLVTYASGIKKNACGNQQDAIEKFLKLPIQNRKIEIAGISLEIPEEIHLPSVQPSFLIQLLQLILASEGDPRSVYPFLQENLGQLNIELIDSLHNWPENSSLSLKQGRPQELATLIAVFSNLLQGFPLGSRAMNLEIAIAGYEISLSIFTLDDFPYEWANTLNNLAAAYRDRIRGNRAENLERAIYYCQSVLEVFTRNEFPEQWAKTQNNLAVAYQGRIQGDRAENLEQAIYYCQNVLEVFTRNEFPEQWAETQNNLAVAYQGRIRGDRAENLERAIYYCQNVLEVFTRDEFPEQWAETQNNLAAAYQGRIRGDRAENLERAIYYCQNVLEVFTRDEFPEQWAETQNNLAAAYQGRIRGDRAENLERAIYYCQNVFEVFTREAFPIRWADTLQHLAAAYRDRIRGDRSENLEQAIYYCHNVLGIFTREAFPVRWADTLQHLAAAYRDRIRGDRSENLEQAIYYCHNVLGIFTREAFPVRWADTLQHLAAAYRDRIRGDRSENLEQAIHCYDNALQIFVLEAFPEEYLDSVFSLALTFQELQNFHQAYDTLALAIDSFELFQGAAIEFSGMEIGTVRLTEIYSQMVTVCLQLDRTKEALEYVERSKNRKLVEKLVERLVEQPLNRNLLTFFSPEVVTQLEQYREEIATVNDQIQNGEAKNPQALIQHLQQLQQQCNELQKRYLPIGSGFDFERFQQTLDARTVIVEFYVIKDKFLIFIITRQPQEPIVWQSQAKDLDELVNWANEYLKSYHNESSDWKTHLSSRLHLLARILHIDEIIQSIPPEYNRLILIPHQVLYLLPLHALSINSQHDEEISEILIDRFPGGISYTPSCQFLQLSQIRERPSLQTLLAIQNPTGDLSFSNFEVESIERYFAFAQVFARESATKKALDSANLSAVNCIHFSGHSYFKLESPLESALLLAETKPREILQDKISEDRLLTLREIFDLDLSQCCLVTLSASETAVTDVTNAGDEYISFPSAFLYAGSRNVSGSFWDVSDLSTALLMIRFYENLCLEIPCSIAEALTQAQQWIRTVTGREIAQWVQEKNLTPTLKVSLRRMLRNQSDSQPFQSPFYWAAFCIFGQ